MIKLYLKIKNAFGASVVITKLTTVMVLSVLFTPSLSAQNYTVNSSMDSHAASPATSPNDGGGAITLRSAIEAATANAGAHIITIPAAVGTVINLSLGQIITGASGAGNNITVNGPGVSLLTINQTTEAKVFVTGTGAISLSLTNFTLNYTGPAATGIVAGNGAAVLAGGAGAATTLNNLAITNFKIQLDNGGAVAVSSANNTHSLTIINCTFTNNLCGAAGGAVFYNGLGSCSISNTIFTNNSTGVVGANNGGDGGAVATTGNGSGGNYSISNCSFLNNTVTAATGHGGAISNANGTSTISFCRFINNTASVATNGNTLSQAGGGTINTIIADNNWWGQNAPATNDYAVSATPGIVTVTKWIQLKSTSSVASVCSNNTATITAGFLSNSANETLTTANVSALIGLPISFSALQGTVSSPQTTIQANGNATAVYTAGPSAGSGSANAVVDAVPNNDGIAMATVTILIAPTITTSPANSTLCQGLPVALSAAAANQTSVTWQQSADAAFTSPVTLTNAGIYSGSQTTTLTIADNTSVNGNYFRMVAANSNGCTAANSTAALITVTTPTLSTNNTVTQSVNQNNNLFYNGSCGIISKVIPSGTNPITGNLTSEVWVEPTVPSINNIPFGQRHYQLTPATNPATATATVTLYFTQAEFDNFNSNPGSTLNLPSAPGDGTGISNIRIGKYAGVSSDGSGLPASYASGETIINPIDANIIWNATNNRWEITFDTDGFSGFIIQTDNIILPIKLSLFTAQLLNNTAVIKWKIESAENHSFYNLQRSTDGIHFITIITKSGDDITTQFNYTDPLVANGNYYYRLQLTDNANTTSFSTIKLIKFNNAGDGIFLSPNPVKKGDKLSINLTNITGKSVQIINNAGKILFKIDKNLNGAASFIVPGNIATGTYFIKIVSDKNVIIKKVVIQ